MNAWLNYKLLFLVGVHQLASQLVQQWLKIVKDETQSEIATQNQIQTLNQVEVVPTFVSVVAAPPTVAIPTEPVQIVEISPSEDNTEIVHVESPEKTVSSSCYKLAVRDGKHVLCKVPANEANVSVVENTVIEEVKAEETKESKKEEKSKENKEKSSRDKEKKRSSDSSRSKSSSKDRGRSSSSSSSKSREKDRKSSSSSSRSKDRKDHEKDKHRSNGSLKHSSSKSSSSSSSSSSKDKKETKEKQAEKDKDTLAKLQPQSLNKLGRIPRKSSDEKIKEDDKKKQEKKASMGIEVKNPNEPRPKTVKVYNSKMRSTGLLEEAKPPPPRNAKKATAPPTIPPNLPVKRSSPIRELIPPPEKKTKLEIPERPGAIKLIPPKPKRKFARNRYLFSILVFSGFGFGSNNCLQTVCRSRRYYRRKDGCESSSNVFQYFLSSITLFLGCSSRAIVSLFYVYLKKKKIQGIPTNKVLLNIFFILHTTYSERKEQNIKHLNNKRPIQIFWFVFDVSNNDCLLLKKKIRTIP